MHFPRPLRALLAAAVVALSPATLHAADAYVVLAGDSTVTDTAGWGAAFAKLLKPGVPCTNLASGGQSSKSFRDCGRWHQGLALGPTVVLIQFGHNDMPGKGPNRETDPETTYHDNMTRFVEEVRAGGAQPVLVSSIPRRLFIDGHLKGELAPYVKAVKRVAAEQKVPLADLYERSLPLLEKRGDAGCQELGPKTKEGGPDRTHLNEKGAALTAELLASELRRVAPEVATLLRDDAGKAQ